ncbi:MAG: 2-amino-4-hydroxy-6-hydroxymethyldihydropteridine diphosphokinase [Nitrospinae bacterium]|nr:2-amino-4-hydroxy-6-hydroxymethyldihydropteridine diphosphokinase [Nitrospinota bacterium]
MADLILLEGLEIECVIGVFDWERNIRQKVIVDLRLECSTSAAAASDDIADTVDYKSIAKGIIALVEPSAFMLIEKMAEQIANYCLARPGVDRVTVRVSKPGSVRGSRNVAVEITRPADMTRIYLGVGGNIEPEKYIPEGLAMLRERFTVVSVSPSYRSQAWGVKEPQPDYINLAVEAMTDKDLFAVRAEIRWIEELLGRKRTLDKFSPRTLDIDLLLYDDLVMKDEGGQLPHPQLLTQQFVYFPMMDIAPGLIVPGLDTTLKDAKPRFADAGLPIMPAQDYQPGSADVLS